MPTNKFLSLSVRALAIFFVGFLCLSQFAFAATGVPKILNYQGRLMNSSGTLLGGSGTQYCFKFSLYDSQNVGGGTKLWPSTSPSTMTVVVTNGIFNVGIGDTGAGGDMLDFNFEDNDTIYLNVDVATKVGATCAPGDGAESFETLGPRQRLFSSGFAINASTLSGYSLGQILAQAFSTSSADYFSAQRNFFSTTSADWWKTSNNFFATSSADFYLSQNQSAAFSTSSANYNLSTFDKGYFFSTTSADLWKFSNNFFSTTSADWWKSEGNFFSTTSADYLLTTYDKGFFFSTTSSDAWKLSTNFFSTTSADFLATQRNYFSTTSSDFFVTQRNFFSTTSVDYWKSITDFFSTTSADYFAAQRNFFSTTSASYFVDASSTIPKTYTNNTFAGTQTFANASTTNISSSYASSTQGFFGMLTVGNLTGALKAVAGAITTGLINLASEVTGILPVANGGTGWASLATGAVLYGNGSGSVATTSAGLPGQVLALLNGIPTWTATTTYSGGLTYSNGNVSLDSSGDWNGTLGGYTAAQLIALGFSTSSADFWTTQRNYFATSSADYWKSQNNFFATTSADYLATQRNYFSTSSVNFWKETTDLFSTTSAIYFADASTTIAKTYSANVFTADQTFANISVANATTTTLFTRIFSAVFGSFVDLKATSSATLASTTAYGRFITGNIISTSSATSTFNGPLSVGISRSSSAVSILGSTTAPTSATGTAVLTVGNNSTILSSGTNVMRLNLRTALGTACAAGTTCPRFIEFFTGTQAGSDSTGSGVGRIALSTAGTGITQTSGAADFAEYMTLNSTAEVGDLVSLNSSGQYQKAVAGQSLIGVVSDNPAFVGNGNLEGTPNAYIVGFAGVIQTTVSAANGPIGAGDFIAASSTTSGVGVKLLNSGYTLGQALESFNGVGTGTIRVLVFPKYIDAAVALESYGGSAGGDSGYWNLSTSTGFVTLASTTYSLLVQRGTIGNASSTAFSSDYASSTQGFFGSLSIGNLTGVLRSVAGAVTTGMIDLASETTGILSVGKGGTGWTNLAAGAVLYGNGTGAVATTSAGLPGQVLALLNGVPTWTSTTTFSGGITFQNGAASLDGGFDKGFFFSTTSSNFWKTQNNFFSTSSADYYIASTNLSAFSTTSADFWQTQRYFFSTTSADYFLAQNQSAAFSTTSADYLLATYDKGFFFSTTSADAWKLVNNFFSTTSSDYLATQRNFFSTTSASWFLSQNQSAAFSTTSAEYFTDSSSTIPKTYTNNFFSGTQTFNSASTTALSATNASTTYLVISSTPSALLKTDAAGNVVAAVAGADYLTTATTFGYLFPGNATSTLINFNGGLLVTNATGTNMFSQNASFSNARFGSTATSSFAANGALTLSTALTVANGGTGWTNFTSGALLYGNGTNALATTSQGTSGQVLALLNGIPTWTSTTTFGAGLTYANGNVTLDASGNWTGTLSGYSAAQLIALGYSTTSAEYWKSQNNFFSTTSADYFLAQNQSAAFSTSSADFLATQRNFFSTSSADYLQTQRNYFSTTSASWFLSQNQSVSFSSTSAIYFVNASTSIPKTYTNNSFSGYQNFSYSSTTYASTTVFSSDYASSTQGFFGSLSIGNLTGVLRAVAGAVSTGLVDLATEVSGILPVGKGGTGWANLAAGAILYGNGSGAVATTSAALPGQVLAYLNGVPTWTATTTFSNGLSFSSGSVTLDANFNKGFFFSTTSSDYWKSQNNFFATTSADYLATQRSYFSTTSTDFFVTQRSFFSTSSTDYWRSVTDLFSTTSAIYFVNASSTIAKTYGTSTFTALQTFGSGFLSLSSSTIGSGTQDGGLFISGGATTTGNAYFGSKIGLGSSTPWGLLAIQADGAAGPLFSIGSSSATYFIVNNGGRVGIGTSSPGSPLSIGNVANFTAGTSTIYSTGGIDVRGGCFSINGTCVNVATPSATNVVLSAVRTYTSTSSWTVPSNLVYAVVEIWGGGGGGGDGDGAGDGTGGGGSGGYAMKTFTASFLSGTTSVQAIVGIGGATTTSAGGSLGGTSNFGGYATSTGGGGGLRANAGEGAGGSGGAGQGGDINLVGEPGGLGDTTMANQQGNGGSAPRGGAGGFAGNQTTGNATAGGVCGGGGGGAGGFAGAGGSGCVVVYEYTADNVTSGSGSINSGTTGQFAFYNANGTTISPTSQLFLNTSTNNIGIGTSTPWGQFSINPNGLVNDAPQFVIGSSSATSFIVDNNSGVGIATSTPWARLALEMGTVFSNALAISNQGSTSPAFVVRGVNGNGRVGIGTSTPWAQLSLDGSNGISNSPLVAVGSSSATYFLINNGGRVGIGTTSPSAQLAVTGDGFFSGNLLSQGIMRTSYFFATSTIASVFPYASTTMISSVTASTTDLYVSSAGGIVGCAQFDALGRISNTGTACGTGTGGNPGFLWDSSVFGTTTAAATSSSIWTQGVFFSSSTKAASQFPYASSTALTAGDLFSTNATTTSFSAGVASTSLMYGALLSTCQSGFFLTWTAGQFGCAADQIGGGGGAFPFTPTTGFGTAANATSAVMLFNNGIYVSASSTMTNVTILSATTTNATTTNLVLSGNSNGIVTTNANGTVSKATVDGTLSFTGNTIALNLTSANIWSGLQKFNGNASTTQISANMAYFGGTATTTIDDSGDIIFGSSTPWILLQNNTDRAINFGTSTANIPALTISTRASLNGLVGVGTSTPWGKFSVEMGPINPAFVVSNQGSSSPAFYVSGVNGNGLVGIGTSSPWAQFSINTDRIGQAPALVVGSSSATYFMINNGGKIGVGSSTPWGLFSISGTSTLGSSPLFVIGSSSKTLFQVDGSGLTTIGDAAGTGDANFQFADDMNAWTIGYNSANKSFNIASSTSLGTNVAFSVTKSLNVVVGSSSLSTATTTKFLVDASAGTNSIVAAFGGTTGYCFIKVLRPAVDCTSDANLKHNIIALAPSLQALMQLRPVSYSWNTEEGTSSIPHIGFIAQEVMEVFPDLVTTDMYGRYGMNYAGVTPILTSALQQLNNRIESIATTSTSTLGLAVTTGSTTDATTTDAVLWGHDFFKNLFARIVQWFADAGNGIGSVFAKAFHAKEEICVDDQCLSRNDVKKLLQLANGSSGQAAASASSGGSDGTPVLEIQGNNPSIIHVGDTYADLGALITGPQEDINLGIDFIVDGLAADEITIDTSYPAEHTIKYRVIDADGNVGEAVRILRVIDPDAVSTASTTPSTTNSTNGSETNTAPDPEGSGQSNEQPDQEVISSASSSTEQIL